MANNLYLCILFIKAGQAQPIINLSFCPWTYSEDVPFTMNLNNEIMHSECFSKKSDARDIF